MLSLCFLVTVSLLSPFVAQGAHLNFSKLVERSPIIAVGKIIEIGEPPTMWSTGDFMFAQKVKYRVSGVLKGEEVGGEITVYYYLFKGAPNTKADRPGLSPSLFNVGNEHILFLRPLGVENDAEHSSGVVPKEFAAFNTEHGALPNSKETYKGVRDALTSRR